MQLLVSGGSRTLEDGAMLDQPLPPRSGEDASTDGGQESMPHVLYYEKRTTSNMWVNGANWALVCPDTEDISIILLLFVLWLLR